MDDLDALKAKEAAEADRLSATARLAGSGAISRTTVAAAVAILRAVAPSKRRGALAEPAADLRDVRSDGALLMAMSTDLRVTQQQAFILIRDAILIGYRTQATGVELNGATVTVTIDETDRAQLSDYPVLGISPTEHAEALAWRLRQDINAALGMPLTGQVDPTKIPSALGACAAAHADRLAGAVGEAYFAGVQAAGIAFGQALVGA